MQLRIEGTVELTATNGETVRMPSDCAGVKTGWGRVVNGWMAGLEHFDRYSDGDTVIECEPGEPGAKPIADAYQQLRDEFEAERQAMEEMRAEWEAEHIAWLEQEEARRAARAGRMYDRELEFWAIQDALELT